MRRAAIAPLFPLAATIGPAGPFSDTRAPFGATALVFTPQRHGRALAISSTPRSAPKGQGEEQTMKPIHATFLCALTATVLATSHARAEDTLKVAIGQINNWENQMPTLGQQAGIFKKHGIVLENFGTQGAGET